MTEPGIYFDAITLSESRSPAGDVIALRVLEAPALSAISRELYDRACAGEYERIAAGEGLFAIYASNGTFRYRLTGECEAMFGAFLAEKISGPPIEHLADQGQREQHQRRHHDE